MRRRRCCCRGSTPATLGQLLALYEHRTFVEATLYGINPFDQFGVELGKALAAPLVAALADGTPLPAATDASTRGLVAARAGAAQIRGLSHGGSAVSARRP